MSDERPMVCICIPTYNAAATIRETLVSILAQTYANLVIHVSDNASNDDTLKVIELMADSRIRIHSHSENIGAEGNFNRCIQLAGGKFTAIFHADDIYEPDMVTKQVAFLEAHPEAGAVFTDASIIDGKGRRIGRLRLPGDIASQGGLYGFATMFKAVVRHSNFFVCPSFMVRTQIYQQEIGGWRGEQFGWGADLDVWLRILQIHPIGHIPEQLIRYRISNAQFSARVRLDTERGVLFRVLDHYIGQDRVRAVLDRNDLRNYRWLERRDRVMRALNLFLADRRQEARQLLGDIFSWDALGAAFRSRRGLLVLIAGAYVMLLLALGLKRVGRATLTYVKQVTHR